MIDDPIINEVRRIREKLASECNDNLHTYFEMLRKEDSKMAQEKSKCGHLAKASEAVLNGSMRNKCT